MILKFMLIILVIGLFGCSIRVPVMPNVVLTVKEKIPLDVGLYIDQYQAQMIHTQGGFCLLGIVNEWNIEIGPALQIGSEIVFKSIFNKVEILKSPEEFAKKQLVLIITPKVAYFNVSQSMVAKLNFYCKMLDKTGKVVYENTIPASGDTQVVTAYIGGIFLGKDAISETTESAFTNAFMMLASDIMKKADFTPYL